jgi:hypothetical protein
MEKQVMDEATVIKGVCSLILLEALTSVFYYVPRKERGENY